MRDGKELLCMALIYVLFVYMQFESSESVGGVIHLNNELTFTHRGVQVSKIFGSPK